MIPKLSLSLLWFPLIKKIIESQFKSGAQLIITLDRTQWNPPYPPLLRGEQKGGIDKRNLEASGFTHLLDVTR